MRRCARAAWRQSARVLDRRVCASYWSCRVLFHTGAEPKAMPRTFGDFAVFAAPGVFVLLWASGFVFTKLGLGYAEPFTFLSLRITAVVVLLGVAIVLTRPKWPSAAGMVHSAATGLMVHGLYL